MTSSRREQSENRRARKRTRGATVRLVCASGALLLGATSISAAMLTDDSNLGLGATGIGFDGRFDLAVVTPDGSVEQVQEIGGEELVIDAARSLVPGRSVSVDIPVFNNTTQLAAETTFEIVAAGGDGAVTGVPNITPHLRFSATDASGTVLVDDVAWEDASGVLGILAARDSAPLVDGVPYVAGAVGSEQTLRLTIEYVDGPALEALNGGQSALSVRFHATSVTP